MSVSATLTNSVCTGKVIHNRRTNSPHQFRYPVSMTLVELEPLAVDRSRLQNKFLGLNTCMRLNEVRSRVRDELGIAAPERVWLLTQPGIGVRFNPVNFYFCSSGDQLTALVAEVTNTPWGERFCYVFSPEYSAPNTYRGSYRKAFHVSPFLPMDMDYDWTLSITDAHLRITMRSTAFTAVLDLARQPLTTKALLRAGLRRPVQNLTTVAKIYWQAAHLWRKGAQFHAHPNR